MLFLLPKELRCELQVNFHSRDNTCVEPRDVTDKLKITPLKTRVIRIDAIVKRMKTTLQSNCSLSNVAAAENVQLIYDIVQVTILGTGEISVIENMASRYRHFSTHVSEKVPLFLS